MQGRRPTRQPRQASPRVSASEPLVQMRANERIVRKMRVRAADAIDFGRLAGAEALVRAQAPRAPHEPLPTQHLLNSRDASGEAIRRVEERRVGIGDLHAALQQRRRHLTGTRGGADTRRAATPRPASTRPSDRAGHRRCDARSAVRRRRTGMASRDRRRWRRRCRCRARCRRARHRRRPGRTSSV